MLKAMKREAARKYAVARATIRTPGANRKVLQGEIDEARWAFRLTRNELRNV